MTDTPKPPKPKKSAYVKLPQVRQPVQARLEAVLKTLTGEETEAEAARQLGLSRLRFQTLSHRALQAMADALEQKPPGRPPKSEREAELEQELQRLRRENAEMRRHKETVDRLLGVASDLMNGRLSPSGRSPKPRATKPAETPSDADEDPDGAARLGEARALMARGVPMWAAARAVGVSAATLRRWESRTRRGTPPKRRRGPRVRVVVSDGPTRAASLVRELRGCIGAEALRRSVPGLSRRQAFAVKAQTLTEMERERRASCTRIVITEPGVVRAFDAMHTPTRDGERHTLIAADAAVPFRTSAVCVASYDGGAVSRALEEDIRRYGPPFVYRLDRAACHRVAQVRELATRHHVVLLSGPPRHPQYYGQLERQNREHRDWLRRTDGMSDDELQQELLRMIAALNTLKPRRSLGWKTPAAAWERRRAPEDRIAFYEEVQDRAARIRRQLEARGESAGQAERFATEAALMQRGWLVRVQRGWC